VKITSAKDGRGRPTLHGKEACDLKVIGIGVVDDNASCRSGVDQ
jgi:hypothetical protein